MGINKSRRLQKARKNANNASNQMYAEASYHQTPGLGYQKIASSAETGSVRTSVGELGRIELQKLLDRQPLQFWSRSDWGKSMIGGLCSHLQLATQVADL
jgi:hypothetical protein